MITKDYIMSQIAYSAAKRDDELRINCPECTDTSYHMYCNMKLMVYHCFKCGASGKIKDTIISKLETYADIMSTGLFRPEEIKIPITFVGEESKIKNLPHNQGYSPKNEYHKGFSYLFSRGIKSGEIKRYDIRVSLEKDGPYKNSIIFPIKDEWDNLKYFVCRKWDDSKPKYVNAPWAKENIFFRSMPHRDFMPSYTVLVEGILDAMAIARVGYFCAAILGKELTSAQLLNTHVLNPASKYIIYLDEDAFTHAIKLKLQLSAMGIKSEFIMNKVDAAQQCLEDPNKLRRLLDEATKKLEK
jgi:DNA primase